jgi:hypothetical protein
LHRSEIVTTPTRIGFAATTCCRGAPRRHHATSRLWPQAAQVFCKGGREGGTRGHQPGRQVRHPHGQGGGGCAAAGAQGCRGAQRAKGAASDARPAATAPAVRAVEPARFQRGVRRGLPSHAAFRCLAPRRARLVLPPPAGAGFAQGLPADWRGRLGRRRGVRARRGTRGCGQEGAA